MIYNKTPYLVKHEATVVNQWSSVIGCEPMTSDDRLASDEIRTTDDECHG